MILKHIVLEFCRYGSKLIIEMVSKELFLCQVLRGAVGTQRANVITDGRTTKVIHIRECITNIKNQIYVFIWFYPFDINKFVVLHSFS